MATLQRILPNPVGIDPRVPKPPANSLQQAGGGLVGLGEVLQRIADQRREVEEAGTSQKIVSDLATSLDGELTRLDKEADFTNYQPSFDKAREAAMTQAMELAQGLSPQAQKSLIPDIERTVGLYQIKANRRVSSLQTDHELAEAKASISTLSKLAARAETAVERQAWQERAEARIEAVKNIVGEARTVELKERLEKQIANDRANYFSVDLQDNLDNLVNRAFREPAAVETLERDGNRAIDVADWLPEEKRKEAKAKFRNAVWFASVQAKIEEAPAQTLKDLKAGVYDAPLDQQGLVSLTSAAEAEIERRRRVAEAERKENVRQIGKLVSDFKEAKMAGFDWRGPVSEGQLAEAVRGTEHEAEFANIRAASDALGKFNQLNPIAQEQVLRQTRQGAKTGFEAKFIGTLERAHQATKTGLENDPLTFAVKQRIVPAPPPLDFNDTGSLTARSRLAKIAEAHYGVSVSPFSDDEADQLKAALDQAPADQKIAILRTIRAGLADDQVKSVAGQLSKKGDSVLALTMGMSVDQPQTASSILRGREILRDNPKVAPQGADMASAREKINQVLGAAFMHNPEHHGAISQAALDLYAFKAWQDKDLSGTFDSDRMEQAALEASNVITIGAGIFAGGYKVQAPRPGVDETGFMDLVRKADFSGAKGFTAQEIIDNAVFESIGDGKYLVRVGPGYVQSAPRTSEGRLIVPQGGGQFSTEQTITIGTERGFVNIPTMFGGRKVSDEEAVRRIKQAGFVDPDTGRRLEFFKTEPEALKAAKERTAQLGSEIQSARFGPFILDLLRDESKPSVFLTGLQSLLEGR